MYILSDVIPAKAGTPLHTLSSWAPAFAGVTCFLVEV